MPVYRVTSPDGKVFDITAPEGASEADAIAYAKKQMSGSKPKPNTAKDTAKSGLTGMARGAVNMLSSLEIGTPVGLVKSALDAAGVARPKAGVEIGQAGLSRYGHKPETRAGRYAESVGENAVNALAPGGVLGRLAAVVIPGVAAEGAREAASAAGLGETGQGYAKAAGGVLGGVVSAVRPRPITTRPGKPDPAVTLAKRTKADPAKMQTRAAEMRAAGVEPTLLDVAGPKARRVVRAVGVKNEAAGEKLTENARKVSSSAKPAIMDRTRAVGPMQGKTADELVAELFKARDEAATTNYADAYATPVKLDENILRALSDEPGKAALRRARAAAVARMDDARVKEIDSVLGGDHLPRETAYHGSPRTDLTEINPSERGALGPGAYLTPNEELARRYAGEGGRVYEADVPEGVFQGMGTRDSRVNPYEVWRNQVAKLVEADPERATEIQSIAEKMQPSDGHPFFKRIAQMYRSEDAAQTLFRKAGFKGLSGYADGPEIAVFDTIKPRGPNSIPTTGATPYPQQVSAATLHRARIAMREREKAARQRNAGDMASGLNMRGNMLDSALENVEGMAPANADYRAKSQALNVLGEGPKGTGRKDVFSTDPTDYGRWLQGLSPEARAANQVAIRQEILDTLGGQRSATFGTVDDLATSQYAQMNLRQALGSEADQYLAFLSSKLDQVRNARFVDSEAGSRTAPLEHDLGGVMRNVAGAAVEAKTGNIMGLVARGADWLRARGISDRDAQALVQMVLDPAQTDRAIQIISQRLGPDAARSAIEWRRAALASASSATALTAEQ